MLKKLGDKYADQFYFVFRVFIGFMFFTHGAQKVLGWFGDQAPMVLMSSMGFVGLVELMAGLGIAFGLFTRLSAAGGALLMIIAFFKAHFSLANWVPIANRGELALMYFAAFLILWVYGARKWSLERAVFKKETF